MTRNPCGGIIVLRGERREGSVENILYYRDNLAVLRRHMSDEAGDLMNLDPPFNSNATYNPRPSAHADGLKVIAREHPLALLKPHKSQFDTRSFTNKRGGGSHGRESQEL